MSTDDRRLDVLRAVVSEYVSTREPVGSKSVAQQHDLGVSSATIRNDMAALEEQGLIYQPHTSAGRVPTDKGYRLFVNQLQSIKPMSAAERRAVEAFLEQSVDVEDVVDRTVRLLAQATQQVAVVQYPVLSRAAVRRVELVDLGHRRILLIVVTDAGDVERRMLDLPHESAAESDFDEDDLTIVRDILGARTEGLTGDEIAPALAEIERDAPEAQKPLIAAASDAMEDMLRPTPTSSRLAVAGMSNLARAQVDFHDLAPVLDALEEQVILLRLFSEADEDDRDRDRTVHVTIGTENPHDDLQETSIVSGTYGTGTAGGHAHLGILGPTRMDYPGTMRTVRAVAAYLSRFLNS